MLPPLTGPVLTAAEMRAAEAHAMANGISVDTLMARAGLALAEAVWLHDRAARNAGPAFTAWQLAEAPPLAVEFCLER